MFYNKNSHCLLCSSTNPIFGKILFLRFRSKCSLPSDSRIFKSTISPEQIDETASFLACWCKITKIKCWLKVFWLSIVKNGYGQSGLWTLKLTISQGWTDWYKFMQVKKWLKILGVGMVKNGYGQSCDVTLKLIVSGEWTDRINWVFACWYTFSKTKSWSKKYWVGIVKNGCGQSGHGTLKLILSQKWADPVDCFFLHAGTNSGKLKVDSMIFGWAWSKIAVAFLLYQKNEFINWADFLNAASDAIVFG